MSAETVPSKSPLVFCDRQRIHLVQSILSPVNLYPTPEPARNSLSSVVQRRFLMPLVQMLHFGCTPQRLAWSIAVGLVLGINPLLGSTTLVTLAAASLLRLNLLASQLATHLAYPIEVALFFVFVRLGNRLFHTQHMPLHREALLDAVRHHPWETTKLLWTWEWHALTVWAIAAIVLMPVIALALTPILQRLQRSPTPILIKA